MVELVELVVVEFGRWIMRNGTCSRKVMPCPAPSMIRRYGVVRCSV